MYKIIWSEYENRPKGSLFMFIKPFCTSFLYSICCLQKLNPDLNPTNDFFPKIFQIFFSIDDLKEKRIENHKIYS